MKQVPVPAAVQDKKTKASLDDHVQNLLTSVHAITEHLQSSNEDDSVLSEEEIALGKRLGAPMCRLIQILIPDVHQKISEIIYASENPELTVSAHQHGADLKDRENGSCYEYKQSLCKGRGGAVNFNWPVPGAGQPEAERRKLLLESVQAKVKGGGAILHVKNARRKELAKVVLSEEFIMGYFARIKLGKTGNHNMSCHRCVDCGKFHRLEKYERYDEKLTDEGELTDEDWTEIMATNISRCRNKQ